MSKFISAFVGLMALILVVSVMAVGLEGAVTSASCPLMVSAANNELVKKVSSLNKVSQHCVLNTSGGYNCHGFCWKEPACTEVVFDCRTTHNNSD